MEVTENENSFFQYYYSNLEHFDFLSVTKFCYNSNSMVTAKQLFLSLYTAPARIPPKAERSQKTKIDRLYFLHLESPQQ